MKDSVLLILALILLIYIGRHFIARAIIPYLKYTGTGMPALPATSDKLSSSKQEASSSAPAAAPVQKISSGLIFGVGAATIVAIVGGIFLLSHLFGTPSESDGRAAVEQKIQRESNGLIRLVSFQKTDGVRQELMGMKIYQMKYTATIEFTANCYWGNGGGVIGWQGSFTADRPSGNGSLASLMDYSMHYKAGRQGQQEQVSATLTFQKTENGWSLAQ